MPRVTTLSAKADGFARQFVPVAIRWPFAGQRGDFPGSYAMERIGIMGYHEL